MNYFHGENKKHTFFEGWYFKHTAESELLAFIPGINVDEHGEKQAFIQIITNEGSSNVKFNYNDFSVSPDRLFVKIGENEFSDKGIKVNIKNESISCNGQIQYSDLSVPKYNIMGPFRFVPFLECNHEVLSMYHKVNGSVVIDDRKIDLNHGLGYIEKDWGSSFPEKYTWIQCNDFNNKELSVMLSIAKVPVLGQTITGCICAIYYQGKEYRLATYSNVKILKLDINEIVVKQGNYMLKIWIKASEGYRLIAPSKGNMTRKINEKVSGTATFEFKFKDTVLFNETSNNVSFEWVE